MRTCCCATCSCPTRSSARSKRSSRRSRKRSGWSSCCSARKQEAERKRVEAAGIKDFQDIVSQGISDKLLEWKGIEATMELVKSQNSKVIIVGNSKNGLPLIYSGER